MYIPEKVISAAVFALKDARVRHDNPRLATQNIAASFGLPTQWIKIHNIATKRAKVE